MIFVFLYSILQKMKKFSFLLMGAFLVWSMAFVLADENDVDVSAWETAEVVAWEVIEDEIVDADVVETTEEEAVDETTWEVIEEEIADAEVAEDTEATTEEIAEESNEEATEEAVEDNSIKISDVAREKYGEEQIAAYEWAFNNGITTINDAEKASLWGGLTRAQLAKMMSQYLTNVLGQTPAETEKANYEDVNESLGDLADFIEIAYAYKIMWINADGTPLKNFNPKWQVTRAEYATVFSRVLFGDRFNKTEWKYYENHIKALKSVWILTNDNPSIKEVRGWVMLMMYRSVNADLSNPVVEEDTPAEETVAEETASEEAPAEDVTQEENTQEVAEESTDESTEWLVGIANLASVYCEENGWTLQIETAEDGSQSWICIFNDGSYCDEWSYYRNECQPGEIIYNTVSDEEVVEETTSETFSEEELNAARSAIMNAVDEWEVRIESFNVDYAGNETSASNLEYCQGFNPEVEKCAVFTSSFHIPEQDVQMAGAFEPNTDIDGWTWYLGKTADGSWMVLTNGLG